MPSLAVSESSASNDDMPKVKGETNDSYSSRGIQKNTQVTRGQNSTAGKRFNSHGSLIPSADSEGNEERKALTSELRKQNFSSSKKIEGRKSRRNTKSVDELHKKCDFKNENHNSLNLINETEKDKKQDAVNGEKDAGDGADAEVMEVSVLAKTETDKEENIIEKKTINDMSENLPESNGALVSHLCDPSIPEASETSDVDDEERKETQVSEEQMCMITENLEMEMEITEPDLQQGERECR